MLTEDSDQPGHPPCLISLRCAFHGKLRTQAFFMRTVKTLIRLGGCPGWSESSQGANSFCWFCHVVAHISKRFSRNGEQCRPWSNCSFESSLIWFYTVCPNPSVQNVRIFMVRTYSAKEFCFILNGLTIATSWENLFMLYANNKGADQPAHPRSLISIFVVHCLDSIISLVSISKISRH